METTMTRPKYRLADGIVGGFLGGIVMGIIVGLGSLLIGRPFVYPFALMGHAFSPFATDPSMSDQVVLKGLGLHLGLCMAGGFIFSAIFSMFPPIRNLWFWGTLYGLALWGIARFATPAWNPTMETHFNQVIMLVGYVVFGGITGGYIEGRMRGYRRDADRDVAVRKDAYVDAYKPLEPVLHEDTLTHKDKVLHDEAVRFRDRTMRDNRIRKSETVIQDTKKSDKDIVEIDVKVNEKLRDRIHIKKDSEVHSDEHEPV